MPGIDTTEGRGVAHTGLRLPNPAETSNTLNGTRHCIGVTVGTMRDFARNEIHIWCIALDVDRSLDALSDGERARTAEYVREQDGVRFARCRAAVRDVLADYLGVNAHAVAIDATRKPRLVHESDLYFNVSHSGELAVLAIARREVGVDVEQLRTIAAADRIATRVGLAVDAAHEPDRSRAFLVAWTRREAHAKARGDGLATIEDASLETDPAWCTYALDVGPEYVGAVVAAAPACHIVMCAGLLRSRGA
jgi:4'-phosphopantetheinyl transferase